jgi:putative transposase
MNNMRSGNHTISQMQVHIVWVTKYRYPVLKGELQKRCRELIIQICDAEDIRILKGVVSKDHVHMHIEYPPSKAISDIVKKLKGRVSRKLQQEYPELSKRYWGKHFWAIGYGAWSIGNISDEMVEQYLEHHRNPSNFDNAPIILE